MQRRTRLAAFAVVGVALVAGVPLALVELHADPLLVALSAPKADSGMTLFLVTQAGALSRFSDPTHAASYVIYYGDEIVYPPGGNGATFTVTGRSGSVFIPYGLFVVGNGDYDVIVSFEGSQTRARVNVEKWVNYVFLHPFDKGNTIVVQAALASATGGAPDDRVLADGELSLALHYRGLDGTQDRTLGSLDAYTAHDQTATSIPVPRSRLDAGPGYYSFEPRFANLEAKNNVQVPGDPTMANHEPPWNWIYVAS